MHITPVILSGGAGTRLWPMSRAEKPKQFLPLTSNETMFQMTVNRCQNGDRFNPPIIVAGAAHAALVEEQLHACNTPNAILLLEPCARNTAPAIALAALAVSDPATPILVMPSDHVIDDVDAFHTATMAALPLVEDGWMITYGIEPTGPETGYGYIQSGLEAGDNIYQVARFVEKPDTARAAEMIAAGNHYWNGGIFLFRADAFLNALSKYAPDILTAAQAAMAGKQVQDDRISPSPTAFAACPSDSIDYAVMEKADKVAVVPVNMGWSDMGSWDALYDLGHVQDDDRILTIDGENNLIRTDGIRIHSVGMKDMIIIADGNDILILPRGQSQNVKKIVEALKAMPDKA